MSFELLAHIPLFTPIAIGFLMGVLGSLFGMGGGVVAVPLLIFAGVNPSTAVGTLAPAGMVTGAVSLRGHWKRGNTDFKLAGTLLTGGVIALIIGNWLYIQLEEWSILPWVIKGLYIVMMIGMGAPMLFEAVMQIMRDAKAQGVREVAIRKTTKWPLMMTFEKANTEASFFMVFGMGFAAGLMSALMGAGGGFFLVPAMMYLMSIDAKKAAGTSLAYTVTTAVISSGIHIFIHHTVNAWLAALLILGGFGGARVGMFLAQYVRGAYFRVLLGFFIFGVGVAIAVQAFIL